MRDKARDFKDWYEVKENGCWFWVGAVNSSGYANKYFNGRMETAHRISFQLHKGPIPDGLQVLHKCNTRRCVNPEHLFLGTQKENLLDMAKKGRTTSCLTEEEVHEIKALRRSGKTLQAVGTTFGITKQTVHNIMTGKTWGHIT